MLHRLFAPAAMLLLATLPEVLAQPATTPLPDGGVSVIMRCRECGIIQSVREVQRQREGAPSTVGAGAPIGLVLYIPVGTGSNRGDTYVGSVGTKEWQNITTSTSYEFSVRMDDGDYRLVQKDGLSDLQVGDRVRLDGTRIQRWGQ